MSSTPPVPVSATASVATKIFVITFDQPLTAGAISAVPWAGVANLDASVRVWLPTLGPVVAGSTVTFTGLDSGPSFGGDVISYVPPPADLFGANALPAAPFSAFPVTVIP